MAPSIDYQIPKTPLFKGDGAKVVAEEMVRATELAVNLLEAAVVPLTPINLGHARVAWQTKVETSGQPANIIGTVFNPIGYALPLEHGARPHWPPVQALVQWARRKFSAGEKEARTIGFLVARKISRRGTAAAEMAKRGLAAVRARVLAAYEQALARATQRLGDGR